jgi:hypothetical protein
LLSAGLVNAPVDGSSDGAANLETQQEIVMMTKVFASLGLALGLCTFAGSAHAWEVVTSCKSSGQGSCNSDGISGFSTVGISQHSYSNERSPTTWEYFVVKLDSTLKTRSVIRFNDPADPEAQKFIKILNEAKLGGKKLRWLRNEARTVPATVKWQGYTNSIYEVVAGDHLEIIID